jgi:hypothetical protein
VSSALCPRSSSPPVGLRPSHGLTGSNQGQKVHCPKSRLPQSTCLCSRVTEQVPKGVKPSHLRISIMGRWKFRLDCPVIRTSRLLVAASVVAYLPKLLLQWETAYTATARSLAKHRCGTANRSPDAHLANGRRLLPNPVTEELPVISPEATRTLATRVLHAQGNGPRSMLYLQFIWPVCVASQIPFAK